MKKIIQNIVQDSIETQKRFFNKNVELVLECADKMSVCLTSGHKILIFGNGGSAADAQHIAAEFVNRFKVEREPLAALALTTDSSIITSIGNDYDFDEIFIKQVAALGNADDMAIGISTSGNSANVIKAIDRAKEMGIYTIGFSGRGGKLAKNADLVFSVESDTTARIQEVHITLAHILCEIVEQILYPEKFKS